MKMKGNENISLSQALCGKIKPKKVNSINKNSQNFGYLYTINFENEIDLNWIKKIL